MVAVIRIGEKANVPGCKCIADVNIVPVEDGRCARDELARPDWMGTFDEPIGPIFQLIRKLKL